MCLTVGKTTERAASREVRGGAGGALGRDAALQRAVDHVGSEHVLDHHDRGAHDAGAIAEAARLRAQIARGERQRPLEDDLADAGQELLVRGAEVAAEDDDGGVEEVHRAGEHPTERPSRLPDHAGGLRLAGTDEADDVAAVLRLQPDGAQLDGERAAAGHRLEAADVAAPAQDVLVAGHADVADVPGGSLRTAVDQAPGHDPAADARTDLDEQQVVRVAPMRPVLAQRHDVHVVVDEHGGVVAGREPARQGEAVPTRHDRRVDGLAGGERDRARHADADAADVRCGAVHLAQQLLEALAHEVEHRLRPGGDVHVERELGERRAGQIADRDARVGGAQVGGEHDARELVEGEDGRWPPARRAAAARLVDELVRQQRIDALGHRGAGQAGPPREVRTGDRLAVADEPQDAAGTQERGGRAIAGVATTPHERTVTHLRVRTPSCDADPRFSRLPEQNLPDFCLTNDQSPRYGAAACPPLYASPSRAPASSAPSTPAPPAWPARGSSASRRRRRSALKPRPTHSAPSAPSRPPRRSSRPPTWTSCTSARPTTSTSRSPRRPSPPASTSSARSRSRPTWPARSASWTPPRPRARPPRSRSSTAR